MSEAVEFETVIQAFRADFTEAAKHLDATACTLATVDSDGRPTTRTMTLRYADEHGLVFFTNRSSRKGNDLQQSPWVSVCFYWQPLKLQYTIEGRAEQLEEQETERFWANFSRDNQLGAWTSAQSEPLENRKVLLDRLGEIQDRFRGEQIPRPSHWIGFRIVPVRLETWRAGWHRLHERVCYFERDGSWYRELLQP